MDENQNNPQTDHQIQATRIFTELREADFTVTDIHDIIAHLMRMLLTYATTGGK